MQNLLWCVTEREWITAIRHNGLVSNLYDLTYHPTGIISDPVIESIPPFTNFQSKLFVNSIRCRRYGLLGPSGCGKTVLLNCILGIRPLDSGLVELGVTRKSDVGYMPQVVFSEYYSLCLQQFLFQIFVAVAPLFLWATSFLHSRTFNRMFTVVGNGVTIYSILYIVCIQIHVKLTSRINF